MSQLSQLGRITTLPVGQLACHYCATGAGAGRDERDNVICRKCLERES